MPERVDKISSAGPEIRHGRLAVVRRVFCRSSGETGQLVRGASSSFLVKIAAAGMGLGLHVFLARFLGPGEYGNYLFSWTLVAVLALACTAGFKGALIRFVSDYVAREEWARLRGVLRRSFQTVFTISIVVGAGAAGGVYYFMPESLVDRQAIAVAMVALPFAAVNLLGQSSLRGLKRVVLADTGYLLLRPIIVVVAVMALYSWMGELTAEHALLAAAFAMAASFGVAAFWTYSHLPDEARKIAPVFEGREWLRSAFPFLLMSGAALVQGRIDVLMLGILGEPEQVGLYGATLRVTAVIIFGLNASNMIAAPLISQLFSERDLTRLQRVVSTAAGMVFLYTVVVGIGLLLMGKWVLGFFGPLFIAAFPALVILVGKNVVAALAGPVGYLATMTGHAWAASKAFGFGALLNIVLNTILIPRHGIIGAAWATAISTASWNLILAYYAWTKLGVDSTVIGTARVAMTKLRAPVRA